MGLVAAAVSPTAVTSMPATVATTMPTVTGHDIVAARPSLKRSAILVTADVWASSGPLRCAGASQPNQNYRNSNGDQEPNRVEGHVVSPCCTMLAFSMVELSSITTLHLPASRTLLDLPGCVLAGPVHCLCRLPGALPRRVPCGLRDDGLGLSLLYHRGWQLGALPG